MRAGRRPLTDEQRARADARREQFRALAQSIAAMTDDQRSVLAARMAGVATVEGRRLSLHNACLLATQRPDATMVAGFNQWRAHGRADLQLTILRACSHPTGRADIWHGAERIDACVACYNRSVQARRDARKAQLAARPRDCQRCAARPHTWTFGAFRLCGRCKTATVREHARAQARVGPLAIFATAPLVDTSTWATLARGARP